MENQESHVGGNGMTLSDPLSKPKKWAVGLTVCVMIVMMLATFAVFHWLYSEYFSFSANKSACIQELSDMKARCSEAESESKSRIVAAEEDFARKRVEPTEICKRRYEPKPDSMSQCGDA